MPVLILLWHSCSSLAKRTSLEARPVNSTRFTCSEDQIFLFIEHSSRKCMRDPVHIRASGAS